MTTTINILKVTTPKSNDPSRVASKNCGKKILKVATPPAQKKSSKPKLFLPFPPPTPLRRTVNGKRLMRFQSKLKKPPFSNSSDVVWPESILNKKC